MTTTPNFRALCSELATELEDWMDRTDHRPASSVKLVDATRLALATSPPEPPTIGGVEDAAKAIYSDAMIWTAANANGGTIPSWVEGGNSTAQDVARRVARSLIASPPEPPTDDELQQLWRVLMKSTGAILAQPMYDFARAVLDRWGK